MYRHLMLLALSAVMTLTVMTPVGARAARAEIATLKKIDSKVDARAGVLSIEASAPVAYVASQPDARSFVVELRDVDAANFVDGFVPDARNPIAGVAVERAQADGGISLARVRIALSQPMRPRVRSSRNLIFVEADRPENGATTTSGMLSLAGPSTVLRDIQTSQRGTSTVLSLIGTGPLLAASVTTPKDNPRQLVLGFANVTSAMKAATEVKAGPVERVRVGLDPKAPLMTQVTLDLSRTVPYRLESSADGQGLDVIFDTAADPVAGMAARANGGVAASAPLGVSQAPAPAPVPAAPAPTAQAPTTQAPTAEPAAPAAISSPTRYTGHPVSLDFQGADLRAVLRTFSEISGLNIVIDPTIQGSVDVALRDVPWDQALDIILRANKLGYNIDGTIVRIAPLTVLADEEAQRRKLSEEQALAGELRVLTKALSYAKAEDLSQLLKATVLTSRGSVQTDARTNTIIINDLPDRLARAEALLRTLDVPQPQVEIEARIVQTTREFARNLGVRWGAGAAATPALGNGIPLAFPSSATVGAATTLATAPAASVANLALGSINGALNLDLELSALERQGQGRILSTPRVSTQNNIAAEITQGVQIPIQTVANNTVTVTFRDAALTLKVTPQITAANTVIMNITVENASPDFSRQINNIPPIDTQRAVTQVLVNDSETTVIGGIYVSREQTSQDRTPALHRLPMLGWLFKRDQASDESRELLIFITPRIQRL